MNFTLTGPSTDTYGDQATLSQIELFLVVTRNYMESVDWVERYFFFGAMYDLVGCFSLLSHLDTNVLVPPRESVCHRLICSKVSTRLIRYLILLMLVTIPVRSVLWACSTRIRAGVV
jgi:hypothetical protein